MKNVTFRRRRSVVLTHDHYRKASSKADYIALVTGRIEYLKCDSAEGLSEVGKAIGVTIAKALYKAIPSTRTEAVLRSARTYAYTGVDNGEGGGDICHDSIVALWEEVTNGGCRVTIDRLKEVWKAVRNLHQLQVNADLRHVTLEDYTEGELATLGYYTFEDKVVTALTRGQTTLEENNGYSVRDIFTRMEGVLSDREQLYLRYTAEGHGVKWISEKMKVSITSVKKYRIAVQKAIYRSGIADYIPDVDVAPKSNRATPTSIRAISTETEEVLVFETTKACSEYFGVSRAMILKACNKTTPYKGYRLSKAAQTVVAKGSDDKIPVCPLVTALRRVVDFTEDGKRWIFRNPDTASTPAKGATRAWEFRYQPLPPWSRTTNGYARSQQVTPCHPAPLPLLAKWEAFLDSEAPAIATWGAFIFD